MIHEFNRWMMNSEEKDGTVEQDREKTETGL